MTCLFSSPHIRQQSSSHLNLLGKDHRALIIVNQDLKDERLLQGTGDGIPASDCLKALDAKPLAPLEVNGKTVAEGAGWMDEHLIVIRALELCQHKDMSADGRIFLGVDDLEGDGEHAILVCHGELADIHQLGKRGLRHHCVLVGSTQALFALLGNIVLQEGNLVIRPLELLVGVIQGISELCMVRPTSLLDPGQLKIVINPYEGHDDIAAQKHPGPDEQQGGYLTAPHRAGTLQNHDGERFSFGGVAL